MTTALALALTLTLAMPSLATDARSQAERRASLRVVVQDETDRPVGGAILILRGGARPDVFTGLTNVDGAFTFTDLTPASFSLTVTGTDNPSVWYGQKDPRALRTSIEVGAGESRTTVLQMPRGAVITGVVFDMDGRPLVDQVVTARTADAPSDWSPFRATTDRAGRYRLFALPAGSYVLHAHHTTTLSLSEREPVSEDVRLTIAAGEVRDGVDFRVPPLRAGVPVTVTPSGGERSLDWRMVEISRRLRPLRTCLQQADGSCTFQDVPLGRYVVAARTTTGPATLWGISEFSVEGGKPANVSIELRPGVRATGSIVFKGTSPQPAPHAIRISLVPYGENPYAGLFDIGDSDIRIDWFGFEIPSVPPGRYSLSVSGVPAPWRVASATFGDIDALHSPLEITAGNLAVIIVTLTDDGR